MDIFILQYNYKYKYLVVIIDTIVYVYKYDKYKFDPRILLFKQKIFLLVNQKFVL